MRGRVLVYVAFSVLAMSFLAWGSVFLLVYDIGGRIAVHASKMAAQEAASAQDATNLKMHSLVSDTLAQRTALSDLVSTDVVGIAAQIQNAGKAADTTTTIGAATPVPIQGNTAGIHAIEFLVQSNGTFPQIMKAAQLFETLPLPSSVQELDYEQIPPSGTQKVGSWQLSARIRVYTTADISS
ncbi:MAG TPA: hypothetical protein VMU25_02645 [Candidatus Paceibacterota bacterium]|nr:hypothetical protein [Candidatus Paceibacterota bacterium]